MAETATAQSEKIEKGSPKIVKHESLADRIDAIFTEIRTDYGHDAFLLESQQLSSLITNFLSHGWKQKS